MTPENHAQLALADMANLLRKQFATMNNAVYWLRLVHLLSTGQVKAMGLGEHPNLDQATEEQRNAWVVHTELQGVMKWFEQAALEMKTGNQEAAPSEPRQETTADDEGPIFH